LKKNSGYRVAPLTMNRRAVAASASVGREQNTIHALIEVDITEPRRVIREHHERTGERLSLTAYVIACLGRAIAAHPSLNAFRKGRRLILLDDVTIGTLVERELGGEIVPENFGIQKAQAKTYRQIHDEIRAAQQHAQDALGGLSGMTWFRFFPEFLMRAFMRFGAKNIILAKRFGVVAVTAVGMFAGDDALWCIPLSSATVTVTVGSIVERPVAVEDRIESHEHLCLTLTFNHDIVDGAPAARFAKTFGEILKSGDLLREATAAT